MHRFLCTVLTAAVLFLTNSARAQAYLNFSKYIGGSGEENTGGTKIKVVNGETYLLFVTRSSDVPVTNGSTYRGGTDLVAAKYAANGNILYATYLGGSGDDFYNQIQLEVINGQIYIATSTTSADYPVTTGAAYRGSRDIGVTKLDVNGNVIFSTFFGGIGAEDFGNIFSDNGMAVAGNDIFIAGTTFSPDFPHTQADNTFGGVADGFITKLNATTGAVTYSKFIGGAQYDVCRTMSVENGAIYITMVSASQNIPVTMGPSYTVNEQGELYVTKIDAGSMGTIFSRFVGPNIITFGFYLRCEVIDGEMHLYGGTSSTNLPTTNGTVPATNPLTSDYNDGFYTRLNTDGSVGFSTILAGDGADFVHIFKYVNGTVYLAGNAFNYETSTVDVNVYKINPNGSFGYSKVLRAGRYNSNSVYGTSINMEVVNGDVYLSGVVYYPEYPVTNNSQFYGNPNQSFGSGYFTHLNSSGDIVYSSFLGRMRQQYPLKYANNKFYLLGESDAQTYPVTDSSTIKGTSDLLLIILNPDGSNYYSTYIGGDSSDYLQPFLEVFNNDIYFTGITNSLTYPVTQNTLYKGNFDKFLGKLSFCPDNYLLNNDTLRPAIQSVCQYGLGEKIIGQRITVPGDSLPLIYRNGAAEKQQPIGTTYQWQVATSLAGPFNNIPNATFKDYTPVVGTETQYYRRLAYRLPQCGGTLVHISDTATATANSLTAPTLNLEGPYTTCPGSPINIGGSPTATGGNPPYTLYEWDNNLPAVSNPTVSPSLNTLYTLTVTDNSGCKQIGQALVHVYSANAGLNKSNCAGNAVKIGGSLINAVPGVIYNWQPAADLSSISVAQPYANPPAATEYTLTLTIPKTGGGTCITKDTITVTPASGPVTPNFAGPDKVTCFGDTTYLGLPPEPGFNYIWSPGFYLTRNDTAQTKYFPGNINMPYPNSGVINLTAQKAGCFFTDQVVVSTIESRAGIIGCGPRFVGMPDRTPNINESYTWTLVSGPGNFTGSTDQPIVPVSASVGGPSVYGLTVSYNGGSCYSEVTVPEVCSGCLILFQVAAQYVCPSYDVNFGDVTITAHASIPNPTFTWMPQEGLSNYNTETVNLIDNIQRTYYVTVTSADDTSIHCTDSIKVNDPAFSRPIFDVHDTATCVNQPVTIGTTTVGGYTYIWEPVAGLSDYGISNPVATIAFNTTFPVVATDGNGCLIKDTVTVSVENVNAAAGDDWVICSNGVVKLGSPAQPGTSYVWEPQTAPWQNGTSQFSAQPEVLVAADITFSVTATTPIGCIVSDSVDVIINNSPAIADAPDTIVCKGDAVMIGLPALPGVSYQWVPATGLNDAFIAQPTVTAAAADITYTVQATFPGACALPVTDDVTVTVSDPAFDMPNTGFCPGSIVQLGNAAPPDMVQYSWQPYYQVNNSGLANPTAYNPSLTGPTTYVLSVVDQHGCIASDSITITPGITPANAGSDAAVCINNTVQIGNSGNETGASISYNWSPSAGLDNATSLTPVFTATATGTFTYYLTKTSSNPVCTSVDSMQVQVDEIVLPVMDAPSVCRRGCVQIGTTPVNGVQYNWSPATGLSNANIANPVACIDSVTTTYHLTANTTSGCTASGSVLVTVNNLPAAQVFIPDVTACPGDTGVHFNPFIIPDGPYSFAWSPDDGSLNNTSLLNPTIFISGAGAKQYTLQVTDTVTGCSNSSTGNLLVNNCTATVYIGDYMWFDTNGDGLQNNGEIGVSNMTVRLYTSSGFNIATVVTNANGYYSFANVPPGNDYYVVFDKPTGYSFTIQNVGGTGAQDNSKTDGTGRSNSISMGPGTNISFIDAGIVTSGATPVTLLSFTGTLQNDKTVLLNWQTTAEYNNDYFDVERSNDGIHFISIGRVKGHGTSSLPHSYSMVDAHPLNGTNYYRLRQVDVDGHFIYSNIVLIRISNSPVVTAFYNNQSNSIHIMFNAMQKNTQLKLFAANGQLVKSASAKNAINYLFELPVLAGGVYMLQLATEKNTYIEKIFINR